MKIKLQKWGNSVGIRIPSVFLKTLNLNLNDVVEIKEEDSKIIIVKKEGKKVSLKERIDNYHGENLTKDFSWDDPKGMEIW